MTQKYENSGEDDENSSAGEELYVDNDYDED
jgi:hypothetical protein